MNISHVKESVIKEYISHMGEVYLGYLIIKVDVYQQIRHVSLSHQLNISWNVLLYSLTTCVICIHV